MPRTQNPSIISSLILDWIPLAAGWEGRSEPLSPLKLELLKPSQLSSRPAAGQASINRGATGSLGISTLKSSSSVLPWPPVQSVFNRPRKAHLILSNQLPLLIKRREVRARLNVGKSSKWLLQPALENKQTNKKQLKKPPQKTTQKEEINTTGEKWLPSHCLTATAWAGGHIYIIRTMINRTELFASFLRLSGQSLVKHCYM